MAENSGLFHEIDDALRVDNMQRIWHRYGKAIVAGCVAVIAFTAGYAWWTHGQEQARREQTHLIVQADHFAREKQYLEGAKLLDQADKASQLAPFAYLMQADMYGKAGKKDESQASLKKIVALGRNADPLLHDIAVLRLSQQPDLPPEAIALAGEKGRPYSGLVNQLRAAKLLKEGKKQEAEALLRPVAEDFSAAPTLRQRALELLPQEPVKPAEAAAAAPAAATPSATPATQEKK